MQIEFLRSHLLRTRTIGCLALCTTLLTTSRTLPAQQETAHHEKLGNVHFPVSCGADAQRQFDRALAMLHSFWYPQGLEAFSALTTTDPDCAMAYWGMAISARANPLVGAPDRAAPQKAGEILERVLAAQPDHPGALHYLIHEGGAPNRFRGFHGAAKAAERVGNRAQATHYYDKLVALCSHADSDRPELAEARAFLAGGR